MVLAWETGASVYFMGADAVLTVAPLDKMGGTAGTAVTLAVVRGWDASVKFDSKPLWVMDTIQRVAVARCKCRVEGKIKFSQFDPTIATWWIGHILAPSASTLTGVVEDTSYNKFFDIQGTATPSIGSTDLDVTVNSARFNKTPFGVEQNEWMAIEMPFVGQYITLPAAGG